MMNFRMPGADAAFDKAVNEVAALMLSRMGFRINKAASRVYRAEGQHVTVVIVLDVDGSVHISLGQTESPLVHPSEEVHLSVILMLRAPLVQFVSKQLVSSRQIKGELERQLAIMAEHCQAALAGDLAEWQQIREAAQRLHGPAEAEAQSEWAEYLRHEASRAYRDGRYLYAGAAYWSLRFSGVDLTAEEMENNRRIDKYIAFVRTRM